MSQWLCVLGIRRRRLDTSDGILNAGLARPSGALSRHGYLFAVGLVPPVLALLM